MCTLRLVLCLILTGWLNDAGSAQVRPGRGPLLGYCDNQFIYSSADMAHNPSAASQIFRQSLVRPLDELNKTEKFSFAMATDHTRMYRWRVFNAVYLGGSAGIELSTLHTKRIPLSDLDLFDDADPIPYGKRENQRTKRYPFDGDLLHCHTWSMDPLFDRYQKIKELRPPIVKEERRPDGSIISWDESPRAPEVSSDVLPFGKSNAKLFILTKKRFEVWSVRFIYGEDDRTNEFGKHYSWIGIWKEQPDEVFDSTFDEPFFVMEKGNDYFFLTQYGNLYVSHKPAKGNRTTEKCWTEADQPISRMITDLTTSKMYAFTLPLERKDGTFAKPVYFEIAANLKPVEYDPKKINPSKAVAPMKVVREAVDVLIAEKKIIPKEVDEKGNSKLGK